MSRKGNILDNAMIENFYGILKFVMFNIKKFNLIDELKKKVKDRRIKYYNNEQNKVKFKRKDFGIVPKSFLK